MSEPIGTTYSPPKNVLPIYNDKEFITTNAGTNLAVIAIESEITDANKNQEIQITANDVIYNTYVGFPTFQSITPTYYSGTGSSNTDYTLATITPTTRNTYCQLQGTLTQNNLTATGCLLIKATAGSTVVFQTTIWSNYNNYPTTVISFSKLFIIPPQTVNTVLTFTVITPTTDLGFYFPPVNVVPSPDVYGISTPLLTILTL